jgi:hypothetical protein
VRFVTFLLVVLGEGFIPVKSKLGGWVVTTPLSTEAIFLLIYLTTPLPLAVFVTIGVWWHGIVVQVHAMHVVDFVDVAARDGEKEEGEKHLAGRTFCM